METREEIQTKVENDIKSMEQPDDRLCGTVCINLAQTIAFLLNNRDLPRLAELQKVTNELFSEAGKTIQGMTKNLQ